MRKVKYGKKMRVVDNLTLEEALVEYCRVNSLVYRSIDDATHPSDGFCPECPNGNRPAEYRNSGLVLAYIREAVIEKLIRDGYKIHKGFDPYTGKEIIDAPANSQADPAPTSHSNPKLQTVNPTPEHTDPDLAV